MITFKQEITVSEELVKGLAKELGWQETLTRQIEVVDDDTTDPVTTHFETEEYDNPETFIQFIDKRAKEHTSNFFKPYGEKIVKEELEKTGVLNQVETTKAQIEESVLKPVLESLTSEVIEE